MVPLFLIIWRLALLGKLPEAAAAVQAQPALLALALDLQNGVYSDDERVKNLLRAVGADPDVILHVEE